MGGWAVSYRREPRRLPWALLIALGVHLLVLLGINFRSPEPAPRQPVFSLQLAPTEQAGGRPGDALAGMAPTPPVPTSDGTQAPGVAVDASRFAVISSSRGEPMTAAQTRDQSGGERALPTAPSDGLIALGERTALLPESLARQHSDSRNAHPQAEAQATLAGQYAERWRLRVQGIGTANFPEVARRRGLTGRLTLEVGIRSDGGLHSIRLLSSSGFPELDTAARRIVMLAAPYEPFPDELRRRYDILHIVRTWEFDQGNRLRSRH